MVCPITLSGPRAAGLSQLCRHTRQCGPIIGPFPTAQELGTEVIMHPVGPSLRPILIGSGFATVVSSSET